MRTTIMTAALLLVGNWAQAATVSLNFNEFLPGETSHEFAGTTEYITSVPDANPPDEFYTGREYITIERADGQSFSLLSMDYGSDPNTLIDEIKGYDSDGSVVAAAYRPGDEFIFGTDNWLDVSSVVITGIDTTDYFGGEFWVSTVVAGNVVPIPAAAWLFGSALAGLG
ncbi:VPLPA-CTERM sorting domain-containing protein, partial [Gammaproteobacteria bacterium]|nr:VPLPA-CTERM sorting domain-containing protein [Gammaproteobacteria bacterium]